MILYFDAAVTRPWLWGKPVHEMRQPHLTRLAFVLVTDGGMEIERRSLLIKPLESWLPFHESEMARSHVSEDAARLWGSPLHEVLGLFRAARQKSNLAVAHSCQFHKRAVIRSFGDIGEYSFGDAWPKTFCTMTESAPVVNALNSSGKQKWPSLAEAHAHFRNNDPLLLPDDPIARGFALVDAVRTVYEGLRNHVREAQAK